MFFAEKERKQTMSKTKAADRKVMELLDRLEDLAEASIELDEDFEEAEELEDVLLCLEDVIDEFSEAAELVEDIRAFLLELSELDEEETAENGKAEIPEALKDIAESIINYQKQACEKRRCETGRDKLPETGTAYEQKETAAPSSVDDSSAMLFYDDKTYRILPFDHVVRICPWIREHSVMRKIPGMNDLYYLYEEDTEITAAKGKYLVGPIAVIRLNRDHYLVTPDPLDCHRVRKFMTDNTETVELEEGRSYPAFRFV